MTNRLISCNFHQLFRNDPSSTVLQMASISTNHLGITTQILSYEQHQHTVYFHQSFRNKRKTRHHQATDFHRFFRIAENSSPTKDSASPHTNSPTHQSHPHQDHTEQQTEITSRTNRKRKSQADPQSSTRSNQSRSTAYESAASASDTPAPKESS